MIGSIFRRIYRYLVQAQYEGFRTHEAVLSLLPYIPSAESLLDVGCGDGTKTMSYAKELSIGKDSVYGIEQQPHYVELAAHHLHVVQVDLERDRFPFKDEELDVIVCNQVLEHLKNIFLPLQEMARILKTGGYLLIGIPNLAAIQNRFLLLLGRQPMCNAILGPHVRCFTTRGFADFLGLNKDFELVRIMGASLYPFPYPIVKYGAVYFPGLSSYTFYLLRKVRHSQVQQGWEEPIADTLF